MCHLITTLKCTAAVWPSKGKVQVTTWPKLIYYKCNVLQCQGWKTGLMMVSVCSLIGLCFHTNSPWNLLTYSSNINPWACRLTFQTSEMVSEVMSRTSQNAYQITFYLFWDLKQAAIKRNKWKVDCWVTSNHISAYRGHDQGRIKIPERFKFSTAH